MQVLGARRVRVGSLCYVPVGNDDVACSQVVSRQKSSVLLAAGLCDSTCQAAFALAVGSEYNGTGMPSSPITAATLAECEESCHLRSACLAFTFTGVNGALRQLCPHLLFNS